MISIIILAIIQALTEFIPVSSSGHLLAAQELTSLEGSLALDVALHFGTLLAMVAFFIDRIIKICKSPNKNIGLIANLVITSIPAAAVGFIFGNFFETDVRSLWVVIMMLTVVGVFMIFSDKLFESSKVVKKIEDIPKETAGFIGLAQAIALIPGTSRSGITMLAAKAKGLSNSLAAEYSFLAGIPVIAGATLKVSLDGETQQVLSDNLGQTLVGIAVSFVIGWFALNFLLKFISRNGLALFGWYRLGLAAVLFIIWL